MGHPMRIELTLAGLLVKLANHYTTRGAQLLKVKQDSIKYHFYNLWYDWTQVSRTMSEHSTHLYNETVYINKIEK